MAIAQDATGNAHDLTLSYAAAIGGGRAAIVTCAEQLQDAIDATAGTRIVSDQEGPSATAWPSAATVAA